MIAALLLGLAKANLAAAAAVALVLVLRKPVRTRFGARAAYALWLAPLVAAAAVVAPHPAAAPTWNSFRTTTPIVLEAEAMTDAFVAAAQPQTGPDISALLLAAWIGGGLAMAALLTHRQTRFVASLGRLEPTDQRGVFRAEQSGVGPAVVGVLKPKVVAPADFEVRFGPGERALILAHETAHVAGRDTLANAVACVAQCVGWFNPLAHVAAKLMRLDQELACDAAVIGRFPQQRRAYAELLLKTQLVGQPLPLGCQWPADAEHPLKERIAMLKSPLPKFSMRAAGLAIALAVSAGASGLAWSAQPQADTLDPVEAAKRLQPGQTLDCKPDEDREIHGCKIMGSPFSRIATVADVRREWPLEAKRAGLTAWVVLQCTPDLKTGRLESCASYRDGGAAVTSPALKAQFDQAAIRVAGVYRLKTHPGPNDFVMRPTPGFFTIEFNDDPSLPGGPPKQIPARFPDFLPIPNGKVAAPEKISEAKPPARKILTAFAIAEASSTPTDQTVPTPAIAAFLQSPNWSQRPTLEQLMQAYPADALKAGVQGDVVLHCQVMATGRLADCEVLHETPEGAGFGAAALKLAELFEAREQAPEGGPKRGSDIRIPIRFRLPNAAPAS